MNKILTIQFACLLTFGLQPLAAQNEVDALVQAVQTESLADVQELIEHGASVNGTNFLGETPLAAAARLGKNDVVQFLLDRGALVNFKPDPTQSTTPLIEAAAGGHVDTIQLLLDKGADINLRGYAVNDTALIVGAQQGPTETVELLLKHGAEVNARDIVGRNSLSYAVCSSWPGEGDPPVPNKVLLILQAGADPISADQDGNTPLIYAAGDVNANSKIVVALIDHGANVKSKNKDGDTALNRSSWRGHADIVNILLKKGADVNAPDKSGQTPLMFASFMGHNDTVALLLKHKADLHARDQYGESAFLKAVNYGHDDTVELLLKYGADVNDVDQSGRNALWCAIGTDRVSTMRLLLDRGLDPNSSNGYETLLIYASEMGQADMVKLLLAAGADVKAKDKLGNTALDRAKNKEILQLLKGSN